MQRFIFILALLLIHYALAAQVSNNSIHSRLILEPDAPSLYSNTHQSTVEWNCVNKALTNKCLVYHNDQWFTFIPTQNGKYFLNLSSQQCRDQQGVQVVIIEGNPCETTSYKILHCINKIFQDDVFVPIDSLKAGTPYLINIDGFLGDYCEFEIQVSTKPQGLPRSNHLTDTINFRITQDKEWVKLQWYAQEELLKELDRFEIYRQRAKEVKATRKAIVSVESNALGRMELYYDYTDTLQQYGEFTYKIIGVAKGDADRILLDVSTVRFYPAKAVPKSYVTQVPLSFAGKGLVEIIVIDAFTDRVLSSYQVNYKTPQQFTIALAGTTRYWVRVKNMQTRESRQFTYQVNAQDEIALVR